MDVDSYGWMDILLYMYLPTSPCVCHLACVYFMCIKICGDTYKVNNIQYLTVVIHTM